MTGAESKTSIEQWLIRLVFTLLGLLGGLGGSQLTILNRMGDMKTDAAVRDERIAHNSDQLGTVMDMQQQSLQLMTRMVDQNNLLIQQVLTTKP